MPCFFFIAIQSILEPLKPNSVCLHLKMFFIGLTGNIGTGKSTVSKYLSKQNIPVIDSDQIARDVVKPYTKCWHAIREHFGEEAINVTDGQINRNYLAQIIFNNPDERRILNKITHPEIQKQTFIKTLYYWLTFHTFVVFDIPLLFEAKIYQPLMNYIIVVKCDESEQIRRIKARNGYNDEEASSRIGSQMSLNEKCKLANFVIDNNGTIEQTLHQVEEIFHQMKRPPTFYVLRLLLITLYGLTLFSLIKLSKFIYSKL